MEKLLEKKRIWQVEAPRERLEDIEEDMAFASEKYGKLFLNKQEFEYFWMLPLTKEQKEKLIVCLHEEKVKKHILRHCTGMEGKDSEHRSQC